jgi:hypothetical protein
MNSYQRIAALAGVLAILAMGLFPPHSVTEHNEHLDRYLTIRGLGYSPSTEKEFRPVWSDKAGSFGSTTIGNIFKPGTFQLTDTDDIEMVPTTIRWTSAVDREMLHTQWFITIVVSIGLVIGLGFIPKKTPLTAMPETKPSSHQDETPS